MPTSVEQGPLLGRLIGHLTVPTATCQSQLTGDSETVTADEEAALNTEELLATLGAVGHAQRLRIVAELYTSARDGAPVHVSELARRLGLSRPLLYMHLERLEAAGLVAGHLELSEDGKAMKYFELMPFALTLDAKTIAETVARDAESARTDGKTEGESG